MMAILGDDFVTAARLGDHAFLKYHDACRGLAESFFDFELYATREQTPGVRIAAGVGRGGHVHCLEYVPGDVAEVAIYAGAEHGHLAVVDWALQRGRQEEGLHIAAALLGAIKGKHVKMVKKIMQFIKNDPIELEITYDSVIERAFMSGIIAIADIVIINRSKVDGGKSTPVEMPQRMWNYAVCSGRVELAKKVKNLFKEITDPNTPFVLAARRGDVAMMAMVRAAGATAYGDAAAHAAAGGHAAAVEKCREWGGTAVDAGRVLLWAARAGSLGLAKRCVEWGAANAPAAARAAAAAAAEAPDPREHAAVARFLDPLIDTPGGPPALESPPASVFSNGSNVSLRQIAQSGFELTFDFESHVITIKLDAALLSKKDIGRFCESMAKDDGDILKFLKPDGQPYLAIITSAGETAFMGFGYKVEAANKDIAGYMLRIRDQCGKE